MNRELLKEDYNVAMETIKPIKEVIKGTSKSNSLTETLESLRKE